MRPSTEFACTNPALHLSEEEVRRLMQPETEATARLEISTRLAGSYSESAMDPRESLAAEQVFRLLIRDAEVKVRALLADRLKNSRSLPRDVALAMARDVEDAVALPMLRYSEVLLDEDIIAAIDHNGATNRQIAVSERRGVSAALSKNLIGRGKKEVALALTRNTGAMLGEDTLSQMVDRFGQHRDIMSAMAQRPGLPVAMAERVVSRVSGNVSSHLQERYVKQAQQVGTESEYTRIMATLSLLKPYPTLFEVRKLVDQMHMFKRLTPAMVLTALCRGNLLFFEVSLARLSGVPVDNVQKLLQDHGELGLRALYNKSGLPKELFVAVRMALAAARARIKNDSRHVPGTEFTQAVMEALSEQNAHTPIPHLTELFLLASPEEKSSN